MKIKIAGRITNFYTTEDGGHLEVELHGKDAHGKTINGELIISCSMVKILNYNHQ